MPGKEEDSKQKILFKYKQQQEAERHLFALENGTLSDIDVDPVLLKEIIYPADVPSERAIMLLEACFNAYNQGRIIFALKNLEEASEEWMMNGFDLSGEVAIFFCFTRGSIFESACRDDLALSNYYKCHTEGIK